MKRLVLIVFSLFTIAGLYAQVTCSPNLIYKDSTAGVYPSPYDPVLTPKGGIRTCAIKGQYYQFDFTVVVGDSLTFNPFKFPLDSVVVTKITGLPAGMQWGCQPPNCVFKKKTMGCASLYGIPAPSAVPGKFSLKISGFAYINNSPLGLAIDFPGAISPGVYDLHLLADSATPCAVSSNTEQLSEKVSLSVQPNPAAAKVVVNVNSAIGGNFNLKVSDLLGRPIYKTNVSLNRGASQYEIDTAKFPNGLFIVSIENELGKISSRLAIQH